MGFLDTKRNQEDTPQTGQLSQTFGFLDGLARSGLTVTSYQPSRGMLEAGARAGNIPASQAKEIYLAMITYNE